MVDPKELKSMHAAGRAAVRRLLSFFKEMEKQVKKIPEIDKTHDAWLRGEEIEKIRRDAEYSYGLESVSKDIRLRTVSRSLQNTIYDSFEELEYMYKQFRKISKEKEKILAKIENRIESLEKSKGGF